MWQSKCSLDTIVCENHTREGAEESEWAHLMNYLSRNKVDCPGTHKIWDDGLPCDYEKFTGKPCRFEYIPAKGN